MSDFETNPVGTAKRLDSLEPQPIVLPSVDEVREVLHQNEGRFLTVAAQAVLDLIASRVPVWVPVEPGTFIKAGTRVQEWYDPSNTATEWTWTTDCKWEGCTNYRMLIDPRTVPAEPEPDPAVERVAKAIHDAEESDTEQWTCEPEGARETYRRLARAALGAIA